MSDKSWGVLGLIIIFLVVIYFVGKWTLGFTGNILLNQIDKAGWQGVYFPENCGWCTKQFVWSPVFETKEQCLAWVEKKKLVDNDDRYDYECGKGCKYSSEFKQVKCKDSIEMD